MAETPSGQEKTEAPTERRRRQAEEKGDRLFSRELGTAMSAVAGALWLLVFADDLAAALQRATARALAMPAGEAEAVSPIVLLLGLAEPLLPPLAALALG